MTTDPWLSEPEIWKGFCKALNLENVVTNDYIINIGSTVRYDYEWFSKGWRAAREGEK